MLTICFSPDFVMGQEAKVGSDNSNTTGVGQIIERYKSPASTKEGMDRQLNELDKLKTERMNELQAWESFISSLTKKSSDIGNNTANIESKWKDVEILIKGNNSGRNNVSIIEAVNEIVSLFSFDNYDDFFDDYSSLSLFKTSLNEKIKTEETKIIKSSSQINLVKNLYRSISRGMDISTDTRVNQVLNLKSELTPSNLQLLSKSISKLIDEEKSSAIKQKDDINTELSKINEYYDSILKAKEDKDISINHEAIKWGLPLFCITVIILFYGAFFYRKLSFKSSSTNTDIENKDHEQITKVLLEVITVLLLTMTVLILGLSGILKENVLGTLLGGIAGYILNKKQT